MKKRYFKRLREITKIPEHALYFLHIVFYSKINSTSPFSLSTKSHNYDNYLDLITSVSEGKSIENINKSFIEKVLSRSDFDTLTAFNEAFTTFRSKNYTWGEVLDFAYEKQIEIIPTEKDYYNSWLLEFRDKYGFKEVALNIFRMRDDINYPSLFENAMNDFCQALPINKPGLNELSLSWRIGNTDLRGVAGTYNNTYKMIEVESFKVFIHEWAHAIDNICYMKDKSIINRDKNYYSDIVKYPLSTIQKDKLLFKDMYTINKILQTSDKYKSPLLFEEKLKEVLRGFILVNKICAHKHVDKYVNFYYKKVKESTHNFKNKLILSEDVLDSLLNKFPDLYEGHIQYFLKELSVLEEFLVDKNMKTSSFFSISKIMNTKCELPHIYYHDPSEMFARTIEKIVNVKVPVHSALYNRPLDYQGISFPTQILCSKVETLFHNAILELDTLNKKRNVINLK